MVYFGTAVTTGQLKNYTMQVCYLVFLSPHGINLWFTVPGVFGWIRQFLILTGILQMDKTQLCTEVLIHVKV